MGKRIIGTILFSIVLFVLAFIIAFVNVNINIVILPEIYSVIKILEILLIISGILLVVYGCYTTFVIIRY